MPIESFRDLLRLAHGFEPAKAFFTANDLDLFSRLGEGREPADLAFELGVDGRALGLPTVEDHAAAYGMGTTGTDSRAYGPGTSTNIGVWFNSWATDVGGANEKVSVDGPFRKVLEIFAEINNTIELDFYPGLMKGIQATAETKAGNPWDQAALLVDRLDAAG